MGLAEFLQLVANSRRQSSLLSEHKLLYKSHESLQSLGWVVLRGLIYASLEAMELPQRLRSCCAEQRLGAKSCAFAIWLFSLARSCSTCA